MNPPSISLRPAPRNDPRLRARVGLTPLIDVIFILVIFFMLSTRLEPWNVVVVAGATAGAGVSISEQSVLVVTLGVDQEVTVDGVPVAREHVTRALIQASEQRNVHVLIDPAAGVSLSQALGLMEKVAAIGLETSLAVSSPDKGAP